MASRCVTARVGENARRATLRKRSAPSRMPPAPTRSVLTQGSDQVGVGGDPVDSFPEPTEGLFAGVDVENARPDRPDNQAAEFDGFDGGGDPGGEEFAHGGVFWLFLLVMGKRTEDAFRPHATRG